MTPGSELQGKVALVTGGARNIGRAISRSLAAGGATVMVNANTSQGEAKNTVAMIKSGGRTAAFHFADVTDPNAVAKMVDATVKQFGRLDILVNNAAVRSETPFEDIKLEEWRRVIATVLDGAFLCTQSCLPHLIRVRGGAIVNIGGLTAHKGATGRAHVQCHARGLRKTLERVPGDAWVFGEVYLGAAPASEIVRCTRERIVHRHDRRAVACDSTPVAERAVDCLAERDRGVLGGVMRTCLQIAAAVDDEVEAPVKGELLEEVVVQPCSRFDAHTPCAVQPESHAYRRLGGGANVADRAGGSSVLMLCRFCSVVKNETAPCGSL